MGIKANKIPVDGPGFKNLNICGIPSERLVCINFHTIDSTFDDYQYFISLENAKILRDDLIETIELIESTKTEEGEKS
jgi:hypothetical protein